MLELRLERHDGVDQTCPRFICDECGRPITGGRDGIYEWIEDDSGRPLNPIWFLHKKCYRFFEHKKRIEIGDMDYHFPWMELDVLIPYLIKNTNIDLKDATERAGFMSAGIS